jgi:hypothetical protein
MAPRKNNAEDQQDHCEDDRYSFAHDPNNRSFDAAVSIPFFSDSFPK